MSKSTAILTGIVFCAATLAAQSTTVELKNAQGESVGTATLSPADSNGVNIQLG
jgi:hypothetical protein